ncbi:hypothetical protein Aph01nite_49470 [Acrocarpospora phusangensis]|uniref:Uncharacterized protein n=1 Tax=Acrocarpospora phusangensis TaxID=1070424 RepID=A0A919QI54_9ACTN|nr:hypothetical protein [Acrocarpospora phusangensis]GIH26637.1 hypothetical protein Aph01nite_49470 [Acrocarpospora phusangensis]
MDGYPPTERSRPARSRSRGNPRAILIGAAIVTAALAGGGVVYAVAGNDTPVTQPAPGPTTPESGEAPLADDPDAAPDESAPDESAESGDSGDSGADQAEGGQNDTAQGGQDDTPAQSSNTKNDKPAAATPRTPATTKPRPTTAPNDNIDEIDRGSGAGAVDPGGPVGGY